MLYSTIVQDVKKLREAPVLRLLQWQPKEFNQPLGDWDTSAVKSFSRSLTKSNPFKEAIINKHE